MINAVFGKTMENVRKHRYIKLVKTNRRRNYLVSKPSYQTTKFISNRNEKKNKSKMNKPVHLGLSILEISKTLMYEFWNDYIKSYQYSAKLCYMDTDRLMIHIKTKDVYENIANDVEKDLIHQIMKSEVHCLKKKTNM